MSDMEVQRATTVAPVFEAERSLLDQLIGAARIEPGDEAYSMVRQGIQAFISQLLKPQNVVKCITQGTVDSMIAILDQKLCKQVDAILHHAEFQRMESAWRSLKFLVDRTNFRQNIKIQILSVSKAKLLDDFEDAAEIPMSGLYKHVYAAEYGQFGGQPFGAIIANYTFGPGSQDVKLLQYAASVSTMSHAPLISAASPHFFGVDTFGQLPNLKDLSSIFEGPQFIKWNSFRESEDARYVGLTLPRFLLRVPYSAETVPARTFNYKEDVSGGGSHFLWGNAAFAFASRLTSSFADYRWCANVIGPQGGGTVHDLPQYSYESMGELQNKIPTEVLISERREFELAEQGFIALTMRKNSDNAAFFSANSVQKSKLFEKTKDGEEAALNYKLGTQLPYLLVVSRLAHYIKVIQRENVGTWRERGDLETELNAWIRQYVADMDNPAEGVRSRRPLRQADIVVADVAADPGWYRVDVKIRPHFKYMGATFTLSLVGRLDKTAGESRQ
ncbi:type VI secretion system protein ImpC [Paraburkholderia youngii]|uniref:type VI secretion system contractile sheath large subunit n=1 Tax=Paraburkholderia youngii TaxID=2782701 RepID=UPI003D1D4684